ncbi:MAG: amino acid ABC transporter permease [Eubacteriales bacterium]|nr:amino acid ABC transporter permease [Eubacteriales bacterium]
MNLMMLSATLGERFYTAFFAERRYMLYLKGVGNTLLITVFALLLGIVIGLFVSLVRFTTKNKPGLRWAYHICQGYINLVRGTPVMVQILIFYNVIFSSSGIDPVFSAIACFGINSGAYVAEIFRAGIESVDSGQMEAARTLGLSYRTSMRSIVIPQAVKNILPTLGNEFISLLKETAIVGVISIVDITRASQLVSASSFDIFPPLMIISAIYLILVLGLSKMLNIFEKRMAGDNV